MKIIKLGSVAFGHRGLIFSGWEVEGGTDREFREEAIRLCAPNIFIRATMMALL